MTSEVAYAPGCFGSALTWREDDEVCRSCSFSTECSMRSKVALAQLRAMCGIEAPPERRRPNGALSVRAEKMLDSLGVSVEQIATAIRAGQNPFPLRKGFMGAVYEALAQHPVSRNSLAAHLKVEFGYSDSVSATYARLAIQILEHCGSVRGEGSIYFLEQSK